MTNGKFLMAAVTVIVVALVVFLVWNPKDRNDPKSQKPLDERSFQEAAAESGINWTMRFLPDEQGEKFKINLYDHGSGVAVGDFDGDGFDDVYFVNQLGKNALFKNKGDGTFIDVTEEAGVGLGDRVCVAATFADINNKGLQDLFVTSTRGGNVLFKNLGNGKFKDVTEQAGLTHVGHSQACVFFDYDNDGFLDLLVTNTARWTSDDFSKAGKYYPGPVDILKGFVDTPTETNILYHNNGDGTFTNVTEKAGLKGKGWCGDVAIIDYDEDGHPDLLITSMFGGTSLYHNNGNGTFTDVTKEALGPTSWGAMGCKAFDFNNDGKLDLYIVDMHSDMWMGVKYDWDPKEIEEFKAGEKKKYKYMFGPRRVDVSETVFKGQFLKDIYGNSFYKNLGKGKFEEISDKAGLETFWPWGIATGDFDNDGYEDIFIPSGMGYPFFYWPNYLLHNNGNETFTDQAEAWGIEPPVRGIYFNEKLGGRNASRSSRAAAVSDFDGDGRLDLMVNNFNDTPYYFKNKLPKKNYFAFRLQGTKSNRDAIGAVVKLYTGKEIMTRQVQPAGGYLAQSSKTLHFGLGDRKEIDRVEILWPSGKRQTIPNPAINQRVDVVEQ
jgi:enediyne biosynthesis protein E4